MAPKITIKKDYILVETKAGADLREIRQGVARLFYVKGIPQQNRIWIFHKGLQNISGSDLVELRHIVKEYYPVDATIKKTALVVAPGWQTELAESFIAIATDLPQTFKVFSNLADAENWVKE